MLKLFHAWGSCSLASLIALEEAGAPYEVALMNTKVGDQRKPEYLAVNPKSRVPALVTERGVGLSLGRSGAQQAGLRDPGSRQQPGPAHRALAPAAGPARPARAGARSRP